MNVQQRIFTSVSINSCSLVRYVVVKDAITFGPLLYERRAVRLHANIRPLTFLYCVLATVQCSETTAKNACLSYD